MRRADKVCKSLSFDHWLRVEAVGFSGGIWVLWKERIQAEITKTRPQFVHLKISAQGRQPWLLAIVYESPNPQPRKTHWHTLSHHHLNLIDSWLVAGDFNSVIIADDVLNRSNLDSRRSNDFTEWIMQHELIDMGCWNYGLLLEWWLYYWNGG